MTLDPDNGIVAFPDTFGGGIGEVLRAGLRVQGLLRGSRRGRSPGSASKDADAKLRQFVAATYEVRPVEWKRGWNVRDGLAFSHIYDPLAKTDQAWPTRRGTRVRIPLRGQLALHRMLEAQAQSSSMRIAGLAEGVVLRGDWRQSARRARTTAEASAREGLLTELSRFGVDTAPPLAREATAFSNSPASEDARGRYDADNKKLEAEIDQAQQGRSSDGCSPRFRPVKPHLGQHKATGAAGVSL